MSDAVKGRNFPFGGVFGRLRLRSGKGGGGLLERPKAVMVIASVIQGSEKAYFLLRNLAIETERGETGADVPPCRMANPGGLRESASRRSLPAEPAYHLGAAGGHGQSACVRYL